jgi:hypothetical protein
MHFFLEPKPNFAIIILGNNQVKFQRCGNQVAAFFILGPLRFDDAAPPNSWQDCSKLGLLGSRLE